MDANELMLGDWVNHLNNPRRITGAIDFTFAKDFEPIPLTAEILEKNGFSTYRSKEYDIDLVQCFRQKDKPNQCVEYGIDISWREDISHIKQLRIETNCGNFGNCGMQMSYVHELQHALRLCGLNGLANNFKI